MDDTDIRVCRHHHLLVRTGKNTKKIVLFIVLFSVESVV